MVGEYGWIFDQVNLFFWKNFSILSLPSTRQTCVTDYFSCFPLREHHVSVNACVITSGHDFCHVETVEAISAHPGWTLTFSGSPS